jgi:sugar (pentulose or hexulose) kinase
MAAPLVVGIDIGTSGVRAVAVDPSGVIAGEARTAMPPPDREGAHISQDSAVWLAAVETTLDTLFATVDPGTIGAIAVDGTSGTVLGLDATGRPTGAGLMYNDASCADAAKAIAAVAPATSAAHGPTSGLAKAMTLARQPGTVAIVHQADWIGFQFSGVLATDENNALKTGYDPVARQWPEWIETLGFDRALLPRAVAPGTSIAAIIPAAARRHGLRPDVVIAAGTTDGCASFLATGADAVGDAVTALGTTLTVKLLSDTPIFSPRHGVYSHRLGDRWLAGGASNSGGVALLQHFTVQEMADLEPRLDPTWPTGLDFYPLPGRGERFPIADPDLLPRLDPRPDDRAVFLQAMLEGIAGIEARGYALLAELGGPRLRRVLSVGGGARNAAWTTIRQRLLGVPVGLAQTDEAAYGCARLARMALRTR